VSTIEAESTAQVPLKSDTRSELEILRDVIMSNGPQKDILARVAQKYLKNFEDGGTSDHDKVCCPFHDDTNPSLVLFRTTGWAYCPVCGTPPISILKADGSTRKGGGTISLVMHLLDCDFKTAVFQIAKDVGLIDGDNLTFDPATAPEQQQQAGFQPNAIIRHAFTPMPTFGLPLLGATNANALGRAMAAKGATATVMRWQKLNRTYASSEIRDISRPGESRGSVKLEAIYPYYELDGRMKACAVRYLDPKGGKNSKGKAIKVVKVLTWGRASNGHIGWFDNALSGSSGLIFNLRAMKLTARIKTILIIVSGEKDCCCAADILVPFGIVAITFAGGDNNVLAADWSGVASSAAQIKAPIVILADHDVTGYKAASKLRQHLLTIEPDLEIRQPDAAAMPLEDTWSISDLATDGQKTPDEIAEWIQTAPIAQAAYLPLTVESESPLPFTAATTPANDNRGIGYFGQIKGLAPSLPRGFSRLAGLNAATAMGYKPMGAPVPWEEGRRQMNMTIDDFFTAALDWTSDQTAAVQTPPALLEGTTAGGGKTTQVMVSAGRHLRRLRDRLVVREDGSYPYILVLAPSVELSRQCYFNALDNFEKYGIDNPIWWPSRSAPLVDLDEPKHPAILDPISHKACRLCPKFETTVAPLIVRKADNESEDGEVTNDSDDTDSAGSLASMAVRTCQASIKQRVAKDEDARAQDRELIAAGERPTPDFETILIKCSAWNDGECPYQAQKQDAINAIRRGPAVVFASHKRGLTIPWPKEFGAPLMIIIDESATDSSTISTPLTLADLNHQIDLSLRVAALDNADDGAQNGVAALTPADVSAWNRTIARLRGYIGSDFENLYTWSKSDMAAALAPWLNQLSQELYGTAYHIPAFGANDLLNRLISVGYGTRNAIGTRITPMTDDAERDEIRKAYDQWMIDFGRKLTLLSSLQAEIMRLHRGEPGKNFGSRIVDDAPDARKKYGRRIVINHGRKMKPKVHQVPILAIDATGTLAELEPAFPNHLWQYSRINIELNADIYLMPASTCSQSALLPTGDAKSDKYRNQTASEIIDELVGALQQEGWGRVAAFTTKRIKSYLTPLLRDAYISRCPDLVHASLSKFAEAEAAKRVAATPDMIYEEVLDEEMAAVERVSTGDFDHDYRHVMFLDGAVRLGHYGALRGLDKYMGCKNFMLIGRMELPIHILEQQVASRRGIGAATPEEIRICKGVDGSGEFEKADRAFNIGGQFYSKKCRILAAQAAHERWVSTTIAELLQAIGRARAVGSPERKRIFIRSVVPDLPIVYDSFVSHAQFMATFGDGTIVEETSDTSLSAKMKTNGYGIMPISDSIIGSMVHTGNHPYPGRDSRTLATWLIDQGLPRAVVQDMARFSTAMINGELDGDYSIRRVTWPGKKAGGDTLLLVRDDIVDEAAISATLASWGLPAGAVAELRCRLVADPMAEEEEAAASMGSPEGEAQAGESANDNGNQSADEAETNDEAAKESKARTTRTRRAKTTKESKRRVKLEPEAPIESDPSEGELAEMMEACGDRAKPCPGDSCKFYSVCPIGEMKVYRQGRGG
jgi:hypothetical protein